MSGWFDSLPLPRSVLQGVVWPAVMTGEAAIVFALLAQLQQAERLAPAALHGLQQRQLRTLFTHAQQTVPHYRDALRHCTAEDWSRVPILERAGLQQAGAALRSTATPQAHGQWQLIKSSGSTGRPVEVEKTAYTGVLMKAQMLREHLWHQRDFSRKLAAIRVAKGQAAAQRLPGIEAAGWGAETAMLDMQGRGALLDLAVPIADQCAWLRQQAPAYLLTYPSNLKALLGHGLEAWPTLVHVKTVGEMVDAELRLRCASQWGVPIVDEYSAQEIGSIAIQCPDHPHYHVQAEGVFVEVVREDGSACAPGEVGRVVVTPLHEFRTPLLRYAVGDYAEVGGPCDCGRGLPVLKRILGRVRNMIVLPDGGRRWPLAGDGRYRDIAPVLQYQFVQTSRETFEARIVSERDLTRDEEQQLADWIRERLGHPFRIEFHRVPEIPRHASGKYEDFVCEIG